MCVRGAHTCHPTHLEVRGQPWVSVLLFETESESKSFQGFLYMVRIKNVEWSQQVKVPDTRPIDLNSVLRTTT